MEKFSNGRVKYIFTLFKLGCLCVWDMAFNDETFFFNQDFKKYMQMWI